MAHQGISFNAHRLEHPYGVGLIDDLHNFFPEILYDTGLFTTPLVGFFQRRVQTLFEEDYARNLTQYRLFQQTRRRRESGIPISSARLVTIPLTTVEPTLTTDPSAILADVQSLFTALGVGGINLFQTQDQDAPPSIPTGDQIDAASVLTSIEPSPDVECSICQDHNDPNNQTEWRVLRHCNHRFHRSCIDTWFQRNTHCPVCRHDIRTL